MRGGGHDIALTRKHRPVSRPSSYFVPTQGIFGALNLDRATLANVHNTDWEKILCVPTFGEEDDIKMLILCVEKMGGGMVPRSASVFCDCVAIFLLKWECRVT